MPRATNNVAARQRRKKVLSAAKGYRLGKSRLYTTAKDQVEKSWSYAYRDRKVRKRAFRTLWITRISAGCRAEGLSYSRFMNGLKRADVQIDRKVLSNLAIEDREAFQALVVRAKDALKV